MSRKKLSDYLHYYMGCKFITDNSEGEVNPETIRFIYPMIEKGYNVQLVLRKLEDITDEEMIGLLQSMLPANLEDRPKNSDYELEMFYNDDGLMVDGDISVGANFSCICYEGQIGIKKCGSIILFEEDKDVTRDQLVNTPMAFDYLLKQYFDLFGLIDANLAIDAKTINNKV